MSPKVRTASIRQAVSSTNTFPSLCLSSPVHFNTQMGVPSWLFQDVSRSGNPYSYSSYRLFSFPAPQIATGRQTGPFLLLLDKTKIMRFPRLPSVSHPILLKKGDETSCVQASSFVSALLEQQTGSFIVFGKHKHDSHTPYEYEHHHFLSNWKRVQVHLNLPASQTTHGLFPLKKKKNKSHVPSQSPRHVSACLSFSIRYPNGRKIH